MARFVPREPGSPRTGSRVLAYLGENGDDLSFTRYFWKGCEPNKDDLSRYSRFVRAVLLSREGLTSEQIAGVMRIGLDSINAWILSVRNSKLTDYLRAFIRLGKPKPGWVWLSINNTPGHAIPLGPFIQVPEGIRSWRDVNAVIRQLRPIGPFPAGFSRSYRFGFLLGMMIGDAGKKRQAKWHRHLELVLSKKYPTSVSIGDFMTECANGIGIRMRRMPDLAVRGTKPHGFFVWESQSTTLVDWLFNVCLGLKDKELTTYDAVRMNWALHSPEDFRRGMVQGLAESDGSVSIASQTMEFWIGPNWEFVRKLLLTFGVKSFRNRQALSVTKKQIEHLRGIPVFAPHLRTTRYQKFEKLASAKHIAHGTRIPVRIREAIGKASERGLSIPQISETILDEFGVVLSFEAVQRWAFRTRL